MTNRFRLLVVCGILGLLVGTLREQSGLSLMSLIVLVYLYVCWLLFFVQEQLIATRLKCQRAINGNFGATTLWADRVADIEVRMSLGGFRLPSYFQAIDLMPDILQLESGSNAVLTLQGKKELRLDYAVRCLSAGKIRFPGIRYRLQDAQGFFVSEQTVFSGMELKILPSYESVRDARPTVKRLNSLPQHGIHQLARAGVGSELLELREYQPGDPPKSIAWKVTARRDRLMTRQYESEVPVRVTLFLDASGSARLGGYGHRLLDQLNHTAASIAKVAISVGDPVGLTLTDGQNRFRMRPGTGDRAFYRILESLADFSMQPMPCPNLLTYSQLALAVAVCEQRYPQWMEDRCNQPKWTLFPLGGVDRMRLRSRRKLANVLGELYRMPAESVAEMVHDDYLLTKVTWRWLNECGLAWMPPMVTAKQTSQSIPANGNSLARELTRAVQQAHDNELFVLLFDLLASDETLETIIPAIKLAVSRHHRVVIVCPSATGVRLSQTVESVQGSSLDEVCTQADQIRLGFAARLVQRKCKSVGAKVAFTGERNAISVVMAEAELAGSGRTLGRRGTR